MQRIHYNPKLTEHARQLRNNPTYAEKVLWIYLKGKQLKGYQLKRQKPLGNYIYDFYCFELKLVIEIDGETHNLPDVKDNDARKDAFIHDIGFNMLRFTDGEVLGRDDFAMRKIKKYVEGFEKATHPLPPSF